MTETEKRDEAAEALNASAPQRRTGSPARTAFLLFGLVAAMVGLSFASVPLYQLFCQVTGYGGTPRIDETAAPQVPSQRIITVRFDANVNPDLPWRFGPTERQMQVRLGDHTLAAYEAVNDSARAVTGTAVFNVSPFKAGPYFSKLDCFCFTEQTLQPGQAVSMPVSFYVDPAIADDPETRDVKIITLSYTFYPLDDDDTVETSAIDQGKTDDGAADGSETAKAASKDG